MCNGYINTCNEIIRDCCFPIYWHQTVDGLPSVVANGTVTMLQTPRKLIGVTAAHVIRGYQNETRNISLQFYNLLIHDLDSLLIDISDERDIATLDLGRIDTNHLGKERVSPLQYWPQIPPGGTNGSIMLGGYPGADRIQNGRNINFGLFTAYGIAAAITYDQISWRIEREFIRDSIVPTLPNNHNLGGISGGPLISLHQTTGGIICHKLAGIISEATSKLEYVIGKRAYIINEDGTITG